VSEGAPSPRPFASTRRGRGYS